MKALLLSILIVFGFSANSEAGYFSVHCRPCPVASFNGSASQTCPFANWNLSTAANYSYYYYNWLYWKAKDRYYSPTLFDGYYYCQYWRTRNWLISRMTHMWKNN